MSVRDTFRTDVWRRAHKDGVLMPLELLCLGLCGEAGELVEAADTMRETRGSQWDAAKDAFIKEAGDVLWYLEAVCQVATAQNIPPVAYQTYDCWDGDTGDVHWHRAGKLIQRAAAAIADAVKKFKWHGKALDAGLVRQNAEIIVSLVELLVDDVGSDLDGVMQANIDKLNARYPGGKFVEGGGIRG